MAALQKLKPHPKIGGKHCTAQPDYMSIKQKKTFGNKIQGSSGTAAGIPG